MLGRSSLLTLVSFTVLVSALHLSPSHLNDHHRYGALKVLDFSNYESIYLNACTAYVHVQPIVQTSHEICRFAHSVRVLA